MVLTESGHSCQAEKQMIDFEMDDVSGQYRYYIWKFSEMDQGNGNNDGYRWQTIQFYTATATTTTSTTTTTTDNGIPQYDTMLMLGRNNPNDPLPAIYMDPDGGVNCTVDHPVTGILKLYSDKYLSVSKVWTEKNATCSKLM